MKYVRRGMHVRLQPLWSGAAKIPRTVADQGTSERRLRCRFEVAPLSVRHRSVVGAKSLRYRRAIGFRMSSSRSEVAPLSLRHRSVIAALSLHYRRAIDSPFTHASVGYKCKANGKTLSDSYDLASSRGQLHQVDPYY